MDNRAMTITRRLDNTLNDLQTEFKGFYYDEDFHDAVDSLLEAGGSSERNSILRDLYRMFDVCGIAYETGREDDYYADLVKSAELPAFQSVEDRMISALYSSYENYPSPEEYMKRLVDRLCDPEDNWGNDTLRLRILKQFIKYGDFLSGAVTSTAGGNGDIIIKKPGGRNYIRKYIKEKGHKAETIGDILKYVDDGVFDILAEAKKEQKKLYAIYGILKTADDLANGKFRVWGVTKRDLYLFAMVFGMTYYTGPEESMAFEDRRTDISINLFRDYYSNNFVRFITDSYRGHLQEFELDPSGQGINYKNYAEMVYLYYISKDMPAPDKISRSHEMIDRIRREMRGKGRPVGQTGNDRTERLRAYFRQDENGSVYSEDILRLPEDEFEEFLKRNYVCDVSISGQDVNPIQLEADQNTAYEEYETLIEELQDCGVEAEDCRYGLWFAGELSGDDPLSSAKESIKDVDDKQFRGLTELLAGVNNYLTRGNLFSKKSRSEVTRSMILAAYYYYYIESHMGDLAGVRGFAEVFRDFRQGADIYLDNAHYQMLSGRNIYDVLLAFSAYAYLYS